MNVRIETAKTAVRRNRNLWVCLVAVSLVLGCSGSAPGPTEEAEPEQALLPCSYSPSADSEGADSGFGPHEDCATFADGELRFEPEHLRALEYGESGLAEVWVDGTWYYVRPGGESMAVLTFDNGPDPFAEGLARSRQGDKIAYVDEDFAVVIPPRYDFGWPFEDGAALVCSGCTEEQDGEHTALVGGSWGYIDKGGREVVPVELSRDEALARRPVN